MIITNGKEIREIPDRIYRSMNKVFYYVIQETSKTVTYHRNEDELKTVHRKEFEKIIKGMERI